MSEPSPRGWIRDAIAAAAPPLDPPALRSSAQGLCVVPKTSLKLWEPAANSGTLFFPVLITPAAVNRATISSSCSGTCSANTGEPEVVRIPAVAWVSLCVIGTPCRGGSSAAGVAAVSSSARAAAAYACSRTCVTTAFTAGFTASIRAKWASSTSRAETVRARTAAASSRAESRQGSVVSVVIQAPYAGLRSPEGRPAACPRSIGGCSPSTDLLFRSRPGPGAEVSADVRHRR